MTHKRNTSGLAEAAKIRREETIKRVDNAINLLVKKKQTVNFNSVAKMANVGKTWLYNEADVRDRILSLRIKNVETMPKEEKNLSSKVALITMLKNRIKELEAENQRLKKQMEVVYAELYNKKEL